MKWEIYFCITFLQIQKFSAISVQFWTFFSNSNIFYHISFFVPFFQVKKFDKIFPMYIKFFIHTFFQNLKNSQSWNSLYFFLIQKFAPTHIKFFVLFFELKNFMQFQIFYFRFWIHKFSPISNFVHNSCWLTNFFQIKKFSLIPNFLKNFRLISNFLLFFRMQKFSPIFNFVNYFLLTYKLFSKWQIFS